MRWTVSLKKIHRIVFIECTFILTNSYILVVLQLHSVCTLLVLFVSVSVSRTHLVSTRERLRSCSVMDSSTAGRTTSGFSSWTCSFADSTASFSYTQHSTPHISKVPLNLSKNVFEEKEGDEDVDTTSSTMPLNADVALTSNCGTIRDDTLLFSNPRDFSACDNTYTGNGNLVSKYRTVLFLY